MVQGIIVPKFVIADLSVGKMARAELKLLRCIFGASIQSTVHAFTFTVFFFVITYGLLGNGVAIC